jgi:hypothetical protein
MKVRRKPRRTGHPHNVDQWLHFDLDGATWCSILAPFHLEADWAKVNSAPIRLIFPAWARVDSEITLMSGSLKGPVRLTVNGNIWPLGEFVLAAGSLRITPDRAPTLAE